MVHWRFLDVDERLAIGVIGRKPERASHGPLITAKPSLAALLLPLTLDRSLCFEAFYRLLRALENLAWLLSPVFLAYDPVEQGRQKWEGWSL